ncbi:hypothetical protein ANCDUO_21511 [Ancylostoma duodenale]|uniref:Cytochrome oxidase c subunit VIb n=1 Tax=Ancylostoma duodenale TaxID=51022 RepID=A0A0C2FU62_9BILA|nr:hypothetical protein ANCDUO_21511 [Ancylostoma duodenale]
MANPARDKFLACFDKGVDAGKTEEQAKKACRAELRAFEGACPASWVTHFIRKHNFERYKQTLVEEGVNIADQNALGDDKK